ncbi:MAG: hypothetical protein H0W83_09130 [Planctomycetes bacterium]|nr:hypothetical protein [Planctomycetota bacterium]
MKPNPHLLIGALLLLVAIIAVGSVLVEPSADFPITTRDLRVVGPAADTEIIPAEHALLPLMPEFDGPIANPFSSRKPTDGGGGVKIRKPPAPPLDLPALPVLPLSEK